MMTEDELKHYIETELLGRPYRMGADGPDEYDCYGVVRAVMTNGFGYYMPMVQRDGMPHRVLAHNLLSNPAREMWIQVPSGRHGDLMVMGNIDGRDYHLAVRLRFGREFLCLHTDEKTGVLMDELMALGFRGFHKFRYFRWGKSPL